jgi:putative hydrolase of the HAD superfamily
MDRIRIISLDLEGTLVTPEFSRYVWHEGIPVMYARRNKISVDRAKEAVKRQYDEVGDGQREWYDINYWFRRFELENHHELLAGYQDRVTVYPEVRGLLRNISEKYRIIVATGSSSEFIPYLLKDIGGLVSRIFSSISDYGTLKTPEFYCGICRELRVESNEIVHIGDSRLYDYLSPREAGICSFHLDRDGTGEYADSLFSLSELESVLKQI